MKAHNDWTKALETALGYNIRNLNFLLTPSDKPDSSKIGNTVKPVEQTFVVTKTEKGLKLH
jgi:hypothetical protein